MVEYLLSVATLEAVKAAVGSAGYKVVGTPRAGPDALDRQAEIRGREYRTLMRKSWFGGAVGVFTMIMSYPSLFPVLQEWSPRGSPQLWYVWAVMGLAALGVLANSGNQFFAGAWEALSHCSAGDESWAVRGMETAR